VILTLRELAQIALCCENAMDSATVSRSIHVSYTSRPVASAGAAGAPAPAPEVAAPEPALSLSRGSGSGVADGVAAATPV